MDEKCIFICEVCGNEAALKENPSETPECCDNPMKKAGTLPICETSATAEHSRLDDLGEPCDDGRAGK